MRAEKSQRDTSLTHEGQANQTKNFFLEELFVHAESSKNNLNQDDNVRESVYSRKLENAFLSTVADDISCRGYGRLTMLVKVIEFTKNPEYLSQVSEELKKQKSSVDLKWTISRSNAEDSAKEQIQIDVRVIIRGKEKHVLERGTVRFESQKQTDIR